MPIAIKFEGKTFFISELFETRKQSKQFCYNWAEKAKKKIQEINQQITELDAEKLQMSLKYKKGTEYEEAEYEKAVDLYQSQIKQNRSAINELTQNLDSLFELGIIPPAYREIDCVITLDHIFENDLADHMRDAVLLYREWLAQERIIVGIENICKMMGKLSSQMRYMQLVLEDIEASTNSICMDMNKMVSLQKQNSKNQEQLLQETKSTLIALEAVQKSNDKLEWYIEQRRQGLI